MAVLGWYAGNSNNRPNAVVAAAQIDAW